MGSRAVAVVARDSPRPREAVRRRRTGTGAVYTRTGRPFFTDLTSRCVDRLREACDAAVGGARDRLGGARLRAAALVGQGGRADQEQYASVGAAARAALPEAVSALEAAAGRGLDVGGLLARTRQRAGNAAAFRDAYARYCWPVDGLDGVRLAPFQILAVRGPGHAPWSRTPGTWRRWRCSTSPMITQTRHASSPWTPRGRGPRRSAWWRELTAPGGEGMVVKPARRTRAGGSSRASRSGAGSICGSSTALTTPSSLDVLRRRFLGTKRSLALREHALGLEALARLAEGEPCWRVHEPVFGVLALESEPVDPRL